MFPFVISDRKVGRVGVNSRERGSCVGLVSWTVCKSYLFVRLLCPILRGRSLLPVKFFSITRVTGTTPPPPRFPFLVHFLKNH